MSALLDYSNVAGAILAKKQGHDANMQANRLAGEQGMQSQRLLSDKTLQDSRHQAATALATGQQQHDVKMLGEGDKIRAAQQARELGASAILAGGKTDVATNLVNTQPGFRADARGLDIPLKNNQTDQYQFVEQDMGPGQPKSIVVGNRQTGQIAPAVSALATGQQAPPQTQQQPAAATPPVQPGATPAAPDAFSKVYQSNPQRLQEDTEFAAAQIGTVYKTDEDQLAYLNSVRKTNPTLFQALKQRLSQQRLSQQQPAAR